MNITMLGTGNALVTECYNTCFIISDENRHFMVDGGGGSELLRRLKYTNHDWKEIKEIFITHKHIDHLMGIIWMVRMICQYIRQGEYEGDAFIYGHKDVIELVREMSEKLLSKKETQFIGKRLHMIVVEDGETRSIIGKSVTFFDVQSTKAKQYGFCMELGNGEKLTCCGDEPYNDYEYKYARGSKWLLHEAFCLHSQADIFHPYEKHHSTAKDAGELAQKLDVKNLLLYHTEDSNMKERKELYSAEAKQHFQGRVYVPDDLETIEL